MAGFPFQHTRHTNVTVMAAALAASILRHPGSGGGGGNGGGGAGSPARAAAALRDVVREAGSSGGDRLSFSVQLAPGEELELLTALVSNRDAGWGDPVQAAAKQVAELVATGPGAAALHAELDGAHRAWWAGFWARSSVHIETDRPAFDRGMHRFYYGVLLAWGESVVKL
jgi:hypothetical protein